MLACVCVCVICALRGVHVHVHLFRRCESELKFACYALHFPISPGSPNNPLDGFLTNCWANSLTCTRPRIIQTVSPTADRPLPR